jgi:acyl dehydratase
VPGVLVLREVLETVRGAIGKVKSVAGLPTVKFFSPLKPDEILTVEVTVEAVAESATESATESDRVAPERAAFVCRVDSRIVASGVVEFSTESPLTECS